MPRNVAILKTSVWEAGSDFRLLHWRAQWAYLMLISQRQINTCGILPFIPERWQHLAADGTKTTVTRGLQELSERRYIIIDKATGELLVRTFIRHDQVWKQPKLVIAARSQFKEILSDQIRDYLAEAHPWIADPSLGVTEGVSEGVTEPLWDTPSERGNGTPLAGARAQPPSSLPLTPSKSLVPAPRDDLWDVFVELFGPVATKTERGIRNRAVGELRKIDVLPDEVRFRAIEYQRRWPSMEFTAQAVVRNWSQLDRPAPQSGNGVTAAELMAAARRAQ